MNIQDRLEIQDLVHHYAYYCDKFMFAEWANLFAPDGVLDESEFELGRYDGRAALADYGAAMASRVQHMVHLMSNILIWEPQADSARGTCFAIVESMHKTGRHARFHVNYEDRYARIDGRWVFQERILRKSFPPEIIAP